MSAPKRHIVDTTDVLIDLKIDTKELVRLMMERPQEMRGFVADIDEACETLSAVIHILTRQ
jgi:hypothetical protein